MSIDTFRTASMSDTEAIAHLVNKAYRPETGQAGWTHASDLVSGARINASQVAEATKPIKPEPSATKFQADVRVKPVNNGHSASAFRKENSLHRQRKIEIPDPQQWREALNINDISHILMHMASGDKVQ